MPKITTSVEYDVNDSYCFYLPQHTPSTTNYFTKLQMQLISLQLPSSSKTPELKISMSMNYNGGGDDLIIKQIKTNP